MLLWTLKCWFIFFLRSLAQEPQTCETFEERTNIQCCPFKKDHDSRDSRPPKMTHAKSIKSWPERTTILTLLPFSTFFLPSFQSHVWLSISEKRKRSEICKWENRYAKHFPILWQFLNGEEIGKIWKPAWRFVVGSIFTSFFYFLSWTACH